MAEIMPTGMPTRSISLAIVAPQRLQVPQVATRRQPSTPPALRSSASESFRDIERRFRGEVKTGSGLAALSVLEALAALGRGLLLATDARRFVVLSPARLGQDAGLLDQLVETL